MISKLVPVLMCGGLAMAGQAITGEALADTRDDVLSGIARCSVIHDNRVWLDCVYGAQQPMRTFLGLPPAPEYQQRLVPPAGSASMPAFVAPAAPVPASVAPMPQTASRPAPVRRGRAGFFGNLLGDNPPVAVSRMASYRYEKSGAFVVVLENGQQWRQADVEGGTAGWTKSPGAYKVTIIQGAFGSFSLHTDDSSRSFRVERVK